jgi:hypothetical protein
VTGLVATVHEREGVNVRIALLADRGRQLHHGEVTLDACAAGERAWRYGAAAFLLLCGEPQHVASGRKDRPKSFGWRDFR